jgi:hypothetical protein
MVTGSCGGEGAVSACSAAAEITTATRAVRRMIGREVLGAGVFLIAPV